MPLSLVIGPANAEKARVVLGRVREAAGGFVRVGIAAAVTVAALRLSSLGWRPPSGSSADALLFGGLVGAGAVGGCLLVQFTLWRAAGSPSGPEEHLLAYVNKLKPAGLQRATASLFRFGR